MNKGMKQTLNAAKLTTFGQKNCVNRTSYFRKTGNWIMFVFYEFMM